METCLTTPRGPYGYEATRNAAGHPFALGAERLRTEAAPESPVNPAYLRGARGCQVGGVASRRLAAKAATTTIPIVFANGSDPVKFGVVASMNRPGGTVTGVSFYNNALIAKRLELLRELLPTARRLAFVVNPANPNAEPDGLRGRRPELGAVMYCISSA